MSDNPAYYMRDNHTFKRLPYNVDAAVAEMRAEFDAGHTYGMLCTKRPDMDNSVVHAGPKAEWPQFEGEARKWLKRFVTVLIEVLRANLTAATEAERLASAARYRAQCALTDAVQAERYGPTQPNAGHGDDPMEPAFDPLGREVGR